MHTSITSYSHNCHDVVQIWDDQCCQTVVAVKKFKKEHGKILSDSESYITLGYIL